MSNRPDILMGNHRFTNTCGVSPTSALTPGESRRYCGLHRCLIVSSPKEFPVLPYLSVIDSDLRFSLPPGVPIPGHAPQFIGESVDKLASWFMVFFPSAFGLREKGKHRYSKGKYNPLQPHEAYSLSLIKCLILLKSTCLSICSIIRFERSRGTVFRLVLWNCSIHVRMKFGEKFAEYLHGEQKWPLDKFSHVNYKRLKKVLKSCRRCKHSDASCSSEQEHASGNEIKDQCEVCPLCDQKFFTELMKEASDITGCFCTRISHLFELAVTRGMQSAEVDAVAVPVFQERSTAQAPRENSA